MGRRSWRATPAARARRRPRTQESVSGIIAQWQRERPDLDPTPMGMFGALARVYFLTTPHIDRLLAAYGLGRGMFDVLATLRRAGPPYRLAPTQLSRYLMLSGAGMTNRLDRLEDLRLIIRAPDSNDRRSLHVELTTAGLRLIDKILPDFLETQRRILAGLPAKTVTTLTALLEEVIAHFTARGVAESKVDRAAPDEQAGAATEPSPTVRPPAPARPTSSGRSSRRRSG
jgi:DNA-binding MarR family transcriptional regulator